MELYKEDTKPLLRPHQVENLKGEAQRLEATLQAPPHIVQQIQDMGEMRRQLQNIKRSLETQAPRPYREDERDAVIERENDLLSDILNGMPTTAEMRRNPVGAVDKHRKWEKRNKEKILEWKNIQLRKHASGMLDELDDAKDIANIERHRPTEASHELNMHGEQIPGKVQYGPAPGSGQAVVFSDADKAALTEIDPEIAQMLALMDNEQRAKVKAVLQQTMTPTVQTVQIVEPKKGMSEEKRREMSERMKKRWAEKKAK